MQAIGADPNYWNADFRLMANIDVSGFNGTAFNVIGCWVDWDSPDNKPFTGTFDGNGHTISNFTYDSNGVNGIGLFGYVEGENAEIKDLGLINANIGAGTQGSYVGSFVGWLVNATISNCYVYGGSVSGTTILGGLVGWNDSGTISNCYARGNVTGDSYLGGLVGYNKSGTISNCYAMGSVTGDLVLGGLVGYDDLGVYTSSFWNNTVNPLLTGIGNATDPNVIGASTANMATESTFTDAGWDFFEVWDICEFVAYPRLQRQIPSAELACPYGVTMIDFAVLAQAWQSTPTGDNWDSGCDLDGDEHIGVGDLAIACNQWMEGI